METTRLGRTDLEVSRLCLGTWQFGGDWGRLEAEDAKAAVRRALELGVTFFDTAQAYGFGDSEQTLAAALGDDLRRDDVVVATKGGLRMEEGELIRDASAGSIRQGVEESLGYLGVEAIDLWQLHWPDAETPAEETAAALRELRDEGKIRHVGVSNFSVQEMEALESEIAVETLQPPYHLFRRDAERDTLPWCEDHGIGVLAYGPLAHGLLSGKIDRDWRPAEDDWRAGSGLFSGEGFERNLEVVERLRGLAAEHGWSVPQLAVAWTLSHPAVHAAIVGARNPEQIEGTAPAGEIRLDDDTKAEIESIMEDAVGVGGPTPEAA